MPQKNHQNPQYTARRIVDIHTVHRIGQHPCPIASRCLPWYTRAMDEALPNPLPDASAPSKAVVPYDPELALDICARVAGGESLSEISEEAGYPKPRIFYTWVARYEELAKLYSQSREMQGHFYFDKAIGLAHDTSAGPNGLDPKRAQVAIVAFFTAAGRLAPRFYSEKAQKVPAIAIQINTTLGMSGATKVEVEEGVYHVEAHIVPEGDGEPGSDGLGKSPVPAKAGPRRKATKAKRGRVG